LIARWLILADDLTGAADAGVAFARRGWAAEVSWGDGASEADVLALDADTRHRPPDAAGAAHVDLLRAQRTPGARLFKKIDSTLRGQPAAEIASLLGALRQAGQPTMAVVAPAFPATGRTTVSGHVWLQGAPLEASPLWAGDHSYRNADLRAVLASAGVSTRLLDLGAVRSDAEGALRAALADGVEAVICDAAEPGDLEALAQAGLRLGESLLWAGSAGLATALATVLPAGTARAVALPPKRAGTLIVIGSLAAASREAASWLEEGGTATWDVAPRWLLEEDPRVETLAEAVAVKLARGCDALVRIGADAHPAGGDWLARWLRRWPPRYAGWVPSSRPAEKPRAPCWSAVARDRYVCLTRWSRGCRWR
jgi:uncharacterized protein YgbK (DUF1537 family)